nr:hypothetical protein [Treponema sp.]
MSVSSEKVEIDADGETLTVPASVTYYAHFEKDSDGNYPTLDKYAKITCYPVYTKYSPESGSEISRVVYKVTEKSIEDYLSALKAVFSTLSKE